MEIKITHVRYMRYLDTLKQRCEDLYTVSADLSKGSLNLEGVTKLEELCGDLKKMVNLYSDLMEIEDQRLRKVSSSLQIADGILADIFSGEK